MSKCKFDGIGRLGADAETSTTKNGTAVLSWRMACDRGYGENKQTEWVKCAIFGKRAEGNLGQYLRKGSLVAVRGDLKTDAYLDKQGQAKASAEVFVDELNLLGGNDAAPQQRNNHPQQQQQQQQQQRPQQDDFGDEQIPF